jgi:mRNA interferase HigB
MRVISDAPLREFCERHPAAADAIWAWRDIILKSTFDGFAGLKRTFNSVDKAGDHYVFNIGGNKFHLIAAIHFNRQMLFVRHVFTHKEYDTWKP